MPEDKTRADKPRARTAKSKPDGFTPFADASAVRTLGALSFENGTDRIALHGTLDLTRDKAGLEQARLLKATIDAIVKALEDDALPEQVAEAADEAPTTIRNPFA